MPEITKSTLSFKTSLRASITLSAGLPSTEYAATPSIGALISTILRGWRNVTEVPTPLWSLSGATTVTVATSRSSFTSAQSPSAYMPSSLLTSIFMGVAPKPFEFIISPERGQTRRLITKYRLKIQSALQAKRQRSPF